MLLCFSKVPDVKCPPKALHAKCSPRLQVLCPSNFPDAKSPPKTPVVKCLQKGPRCCVPQKPLMLSVPQSPRYCVLQRYQVLSGPPRSQVLCPPKTPVVKCPPKAPDSKCPSEVPGVKCPPKIYNGNQRSWFPAYSAAGGPAPAVKKATLLRHGLRRGRGTLVPSYSSFLLQEMNYLTVPRASVTICHLTIVPREIQPGNQSLKSPKPGEKYSFLLEKVIISSICQRDKTGPLFRMKICQFEL